MGSIVQFKKQVTVEEVLDAVDTESLDKVILIGVGKDDSLIYATNMEMVSEVIAMLEQIKFEIFMNQYD